MKAKAVKTDEKFAGNKYGRIHPHSRVDRYYGVFINGTTYGEGNFSVRDGARLAAELINRGHDILLVVNSNCDDCVRRVGRKFDAEASVAKWLEWHVYSD